MKIAIITQPLRTNYGGILQNYALQTILKRFGHTPTTLQRQEFNKTEYPRYFLTIFKRIILKLGGKYRYPIFYEKKYMKDYPIFTQYTLGFVNRHIKTQVVDYSNPTLAKDEFDAYVVGSDQVWRPSYNNIRFTFLDFAKEWGVKRIAYAASFGTDKWEFSQEDTAVCTSLIRKFDAVGVREYSGVLLCHEHLATDAHLVLDPTLLLEKTDYEKLIDEVETKSSDGKLFVHILDKDANKHKLVKKVSEGKGLKSFEVNCKVDEHEVNIPIEERIQPPLEQWLRAFKDADFVITDSFHATVFSIIFNKQFIVYANEGRGCARFLSLLSLLGLENRLVQNADDVKILSMPAIEYNKINNEIERLREQSMEFINKVLKK